MRSSKATNENSSKAFRGPMQGILKRRTLDESLSSGRISPRSTRRHQQQTVGFDVVRIYVHPIIRGDFTGVKGGGPSLTIGWEAQSEEVITVREADVRRNLRGNKTIKVFTRQERCLILIASGYNVIELVDKEEDQQEKEQETKLFERIKAAATKLVFPGADSSPMKKGVGNTAA